PRGKRVNETVGQRDSGPPRQRANQATGQPGNGPTRQRANQATGQPGDGPTRRRANRTSMKDASVHSSAHSSPHPDPLPEGEGGRVAVEPLDPQVASIQPGGGVCMRIELAWGRLRRRYLKIFRRGYLARMEATREGVANRCPHEVLDPRDLKFYRNQGGYYWEPEDDPFRWREHLPFVREGL